MVGHREIVTQHWPGRLAGSAHDDKEFVEKFDYILGNPWKRWPELAEYAWVWPARC